MKRALIAFAAFGFSVLRADAQAPLETGFVYQGQLMESGAPADGLYDVRILLYDSATGGALVAGPICSEDVAVVDSLITIPIDFGAAAFNGDSRWLQISVRRDTGLSCASSSGFTMLNPRQPVTATPYALALRLPYEASASVQSGSPLRITNTYMGPLFTATGVWGEARHPAGRGVYGLNTSATGIGSGVYGETLSSTGYGVIGLCSSTSGANSGVFGRSDSSSGSGVFGKTTSTSGLAPGVKGQSTSQSGYGVYGLASSVTGSASGVFGEADSPDGAGVEGFCQDGYGVIGRTTNNVGVLGQSLALNTLTYGVIGECVSLTGRGVYGHALNTGANYGVFGSAGGSSAYGVWSMGRFGASGTKSFRIDHPLDPENKYLNHYCTEAPQPLNVYSGAIHLDENGQIWVKLPSYFEQVNSDPRILLTAAGSPMPNLHASAEIVGGRFQIAGGAPEGKVYWRVEAVRSDRWVKQYGAPEECEKLAHERGKYQHPELYGQPPERGINYQPDSERNTRSVADKE